ncbi:MAG: hypothetical protein U1D97_04365, partial [Desulfuromonadales bacterium]|nr:hypothetical protein [Desulfuromonadales bacterium]
GGFGSLRDALRARKPVVAVPRLPELGECQDDQAEVTEALAAEGRVVSIRDVACLAEALGRAKAMAVAEPYESRIPELVAQKVKEALGSRG